MNYKSLINSYAVNLAIYGKTKDTCFESLKHNAQKELIEAYTASLSKFDADDLAQSICDRLGINPAFLIGIGKLNDKETKLIQAEFKKDIAHWINEKLTDTYICELGNRETHIAEYRADWEDAA
jgi:hypothetical protein